MPANQATATIEDYDREKSGTSVNIGPLTAANFTAKRAAIDAWVDALADLILGEVRKVNITRCLPKVQPSLQTRTPNGRRNG